MGARGSLRYLLTIVWLPLFLAACSNGTGSVEERPEPPPAAPAEASFVVSGTVSGVSGQGLVLQNNGTDDLAITANGTFTFPISLGSGAPYNVTVRTQPSSPAQTCTVANGSGTMGSADVTNVAVTCAAGAISIGGTVTGLLTRSSVGLTNNGNDNITVTANGSFVFPTPVASGADYFVTVSSNPANPPQSCAVSNGSGTAGSANVTDVVVTCSTNYTVGGTINGLVGSGLTLRLNDADNLAIPSGQSTFAFSTFLESGAQYRVTVATQPSNPTQVCTVASGDGSIASSNVTGVAVTCVTPTHSIGGTVSGLRGIGLVLQNNDSDDLTIQSDGSFMFTTEQPAGQPYLVTVRTQPTQPLQICTVANGTGTVTADVTNVRISCATRTFPVSVSVSGLLGSGLELQNNGETLGISTDGTHTFTKEVASGSTYTVAVRTSPSNPTQSCVVANGTGTVTTAAVTNVSVTCTTSSFTVGGTISGLSGSGLVLQNNGETLPIDSAGAFAFPSAVPSGATYSVTVATQPSNPTQVCTVTNHEGTVGGANVTDISVGCVTTEFTVGGEVEGLAGSGLVIQNNGGDNLAIASNGRFVFPDSLLPETQYSVTVATPPSSPAQDCVVSNATGIIDDSDVDGVRIVCTTIEFALSGTVSGLTGGSVLLRNGADIIEVESNGGFVFPTLVRTGQTYNVLVAAHPTTPPQICFISNGSGIMPSAAVDDVQVLCSRFPFLP